MSWWVLQALRIYVAVGVAYALFVLFWMGVVYRVDFKDFKPWRIFSVTLAWPYWLWRGLQNVFNSNSRCR